MERRFTMTIYTSFGIFTTKDFGFTWETKISEELWLLLSLGQFIFENAWKIISEEDDGVVVILESDDGEVYAEDWVDMEKLKTDDVKKLITTILDNILFLKGSRDNILLPWEI